MNTIIDIQKDYRDTLKTENFGHTISREDGFYACKQILKNIILPSCSSEKLNIPPSGKSVAVMFSGGYDSTYLVIKNLEEGNEVYPIDIILDKNNYIIKKVIILKLQSIYGARLHDICTIANCCFPVESDFHPNSNGLGINQQPKCAFCAAFLPSIILDNISEIQIGYVVTDCAISF